MRMVRGAASPDEAGKKAKKLTKAMRKVVRHKRQDQDLPPGLMKALENEDLIDVRSNGRWHWTPLGRLTVLRIEQEDE